MIPNKWLVITGYIHTHCRVTKKKENQNKDDSADGWITSLISETFASLLCGGQQRQQVHHREEQQGGRATAAKMTPARNNNEPKPKKRERKWRGIWSLENMKWQRVPFVWQLTWYKADTVHPLGVDLQSGSNAKTRSVGRERERKGKRAAGGILNINKEKKKGCLFETGSSVNQWRHKSSSHLPPSDVLCPSRGCRVYLPSAAQTHLWLPPQILLLTSSPFIWLDRVHCRFSLLSALQRWQTG